MDNYLHSVTKLIDEHGWMVQGVFPTEESPGSPFAYTVGLTAHGLPELATVGLPLEVAHSILNDLAARAANDGKRYEHGEVISDVLADGFNVTVVAGDYSDHTVWPGIARRVYGADQVKLMQIVWPDGAGLFPWDDGYSIDPAAQPVIGRPA